VTLASTGDLVASAAETDTAVLALNVITLEHAEGIADGVERAGVAAVLQLSENTVRFHGGRIAPLLAACAQIAAHSSAPLSIHLDHFQDVTLINEALNVLISAHGAGSFSESSPMQRIWRDSNTAARHSIALPAVANEIYGKALLGVENTVSVLV